MRNLMLILMIAAVYAATAVLCSALAIPGTVVSSIWPPAGIALAAVIIFGDIALPGIFIGCFIADFHMFTGGGALLPTFLNALAPAIGGTLQAYIGKYAIKRLSGSYNIFTSTHSILCFILVSAFGACLVNATLGVSTLVMTGNIALKDFPYDWITWWIADSVGVISVTSTILAWAQPKQNGISYWNAAKLSITWVLILILGYITRAVHLHLYYQFIPFAIWAAFQFNIRFSLLTGLVISSVCLYGTIIGFNTIHPKNPTTAIILAQIFISIIFLTILLINSILSERKAAYRRLKYLNAELEQKVLERTKDLSESNIQLQTEKNRAIDALEALKHSHARLMESEKMASLGLLTSGVAHEIKNPLNAMTANMESIKSNTNHVAEVIENTIIDQTIKNEVTHTEENTESLITATKEGIKRTSGIIADLCAFARSDEPEMILTDLHRNIDSTLNLLNSEIKGCITIIKEYGIIPQIPCHPGKINQVIMNILVNGIHALQGQPESKIMIKTASNDTSIILSFKDNGPGMKKEILDKIFNPFFTTKGGSGSGLGLFISYNIIREHNGTISALSEPGKGTEFIITLPIKGM